MTIIVKGDATKYYENKNGSQNKTRWERQDQDF